MPDSNVRWLEIQRAPLPNFVLIQKHQKLEKQDVCR